MSLCFSGTETAFDLIDVTEMAMREITSVGHTLPKRIVLVTDNGPAMKSRRYRHFIDLSRSFLNQAIEEKAFIETIV